jgi:hypothetical protein
MKALSKANRHIGAARAALLLASAAAADACQRPAATVIVDPVQQVLAAVDTTITLGAWLAANPNDSVTTDSPARASDDYTCRVTVQPVSVGTGPRALRRFAVFHVPHAPPGEAFPSDTTRLAERTCWLQSLWIEAETQDSAAAANLADSLFAVARSWLGTAGVGTRDRFLERVRAVPARTWRRGATWITASSDPGVDYLDETTRAKIHVAPHAFLAAIVPDSAGGDDESLRIETPSATGNDFTAMSRIQSTYLDSVLAMVDIAAIRTDLARVAAAIASTRDSASNGARVRPATPALDSTLLAAYRTSRDSLPSLVPSRRAAVLLANDFVINAYAGDLDADGDSAGSLRHRRFVDAGIGYSGDPLGATFVYDRAWLWDAYHADSTSPAGQLAFRTLLASGWATRAQCADSGMAFQRVIEHGEPALHGDRPDPVVQYLVGVAHQDIVSLAAGGLPDYIDPKDYASRAEAARGHAIANFRGALTSLRDPVLRRLAWTFAVRLMLRAHVPTSFICVYD